MADEQNTDNTAVDGAAGAQDVAPEGEVTRLDEPETAPTKGTGKKAVDPSNTYENGPQGQLFTPGVNYGAPEGATLVSTYADALDAGYFGYAPGAGNEQAMTAEAVAPRNERMRQAVRASINAGEDEAEGQQRNKRSTRK